MEQKYWTMEEFAEYARLHLDTARRFVREGRIPAKLVGKRYLVKQTDVEFFMEHPNVAPSVPPKPKRKRTPPRTRTKAELQRSRR
jgi:excisionase family DNA binding protein